MIHDHYAPTVFAVAGPHEALVDLVEAVDLHLTGLLTRDELQHVWRRANRVVHADAPALDDAAELAAWQSLSYERRPQPAWAT